MELIYTEKNTVNKFFFFTLSTYNHTQPYFLKILYIYCVNNTPVFLLNKEVKIK